MSIRKLLPAPTFRPIPPIVLNSLHRSLDSTTIQFNPPPFSPKEPSILATNLIKSYFDKGSLKEARMLFDEMPHRDVVTWTAMIAGYASRNHETSAWRFFYGMLKTGVEPNAFTVSSVLKACKGMRCYTYGSLVHGLAVKWGLIGSIYIDNALMDVYATCSDTIEEACMVFNEINPKNAVSWTVLITGYAHRGDGYGALRVFRQMFSENAEMTAFSFSIAVRACTMTNCGDCGRQIHCAIIKYGLESNLPVMNSILDLYMRRNSLSEATRCFHKMTEKDLITWNTLIAGYERCNSMECLNVFLLMESQGFAPNCFTFTSVVAACANLALLSFGYQIHGGIVRRGLDRNMALSNALIDMYAKCGSIADSRKIFSEMSSKNLLSWTSMMIGYGSHGYGKKAVDLFDKMVGSGVRPDRIVFMAVLSACSHAGLVDEGLRYFESMVGEYGVTPDQEIYGCVVDLLGRAGRVEEAYELIRTMPFDPDESVWGSFLGACKAHKLPDLGKLAANRILEMTPNMIGTYVMLSNMYAAEGKWKEFAKVRKVMKGLGSKKETGRSWLELKNEVHSFVVKGKVGYDAECVYGVLDVMGQHMKEVGYVPDLDSLLYDFEDVT